MNRIIPFLLFLVPASLPGQVFDDFSDQDLSTPVNWYGDLIFWTSENGQLRSAGPANATCMRIQTDYTAGDSAEWRFFTDLKFATSANNYLEFVLGIDSAQSLVLKLGGTNDELALYLRKTTGDSLCIDGTDKRLASGSSNKIWIRLRKYGLIWKLDYATDPAGMEWATEGQSWLPPLEPVSLGFRACFTASNASRFYLDEVYAGPPVRDLTPPAILAFYAYSDTDYRLVLTERIDQFSIDVSGQDPQLSWISPLELKIRYATPTDSCLVKLSEYTDLEGNYGPDTLITAHFHRLGFREVQFTEVMFDPSPPAGLPEVEYLEVWNSGGSDIILTDWALSDPGASFNMPFFTLAAAGYLLITGQGNCLYFPEAEYCMELPLPATFLNNSGDQISLVSRTGDTIDFLAYVPDWHSDPDKRQGGYSLEKRDPLNPCLADPVNFVSSTDTKGGSPGSMNSVDERVIDSLGPRLAGIDPKAESLLLRFSEELHNDSLLVEIDGNTIAGTSQDRINWRITFPAPIIPDAMNWRRIRLPELTDCSGNKTSPQSDSFRYAIKEEPEPFELLITEVCFRSSTDYPAFIELYNRSNRYLDLSGLRIDWNGHPHVIAGHALYPEETAILCKASDTSRFSDVHRIGMKDWTSLDRYRGTIALYDVNGTRIEAVSYSDTFFTSPASQIHPYSLERMDDRQNCARGLDWRVSGQAGGTPGEQYFQPVPVADPPSRLQQVFYLSPQRFLLRFDVPLHPEKLPELIGTPAMGSSLVLEQAGESFREWELSLDGASWQPDQDYHIQLQSGVTCNGSGMETESFVLRLPDPDQRLLLNEILFDPYDDEPDYVELYNPGPGAVDLSQWVLGRIEGGTLIQSGVIADSGPMLMPGTYLAITARNHRLGPRYGQYAEERIWVMQNLPSFPNDGSGVILLFPDGRVSDSFEYDASMHFPLLSDAEGVSLERIDLQIAAGERANWTSASFVSGFGTPGRENSQCSSVNRAEGEFQLYSGSFSPDQDGYEDLALLSYRDLVPGSRIQVVVHAITGIPVLQWANNQPAGTEGLLQWDGRNDFGQELPAGPYLIWISWTAPDGRRNQLRLVIVKAV